MTVEDVMTTEVVTARLDTPLKAVARLLVERRVSGMPVVDEAGGVVGVVSEADVLVKERDSSVGRRRRAPLFGRAAPKEQAKRAAHVAGDAMTTPAVTIEPFWSVAAAAREMLDHGINRLPVVRDGRLVGIVSRADLVRAFARSDAEVGREARDQIELSLALDADLSQPDLTIESGEVTLRGRVRRRTVAEGLPALVARVPGVVGVRSELSWVEDDSNWRESSRERVHYPL
jgi:CBS domain-containing protein